jgi:uncharacterized membrane protein HdeD (DUF308 family)
MAGLISKREKGWFVVFSGALVIAVGLAMVVMELFFTAQQEFRWVGVVFVCLGITLVAAGFELMRPTRAKRDKRCKRSKPPPRTDA